jgi:adenylate cyclase
MVDFDALEAAGVVDARGRAALIEYLAELGFSAEEMAAAERRGRLFGLAGDVLQWSGPPVHTLRAAAAVLGVSADELAQVWALLGLTVTDSDQPAFSEADVEALQSWVALEAVVGAGPARDLLRVLGATMARLAEAGATVLRVGQPDIHISHSGDELTTARAYRTVAEFIPRLTTLIDAVFRHHTISARTYFEGVVRDTTATVTCGVGFADLTGFTSLTQRLDQDEFARLIAGFNSAVTDVVHADGGRLVKFIGDEVMWVSATPEQLVKVAVDLVEHPRARTADLQVRAGLGFGRVLAAGGDYFGGPVNLAARLVAAAAPRQILASSDVRAELAERPAVEQEPLLLKGFDSPVPVYDLHAR